MTPRRWHKAHVRCICGFEWIAVFWCNIESLKCDKCHGNYTECVKYIGWSDIGSEHCRDHVFSIGTSIGPIEDGTLEENHEQSGIDDGDVD